MFHRSSVWGLCFTLLFLSASRGYASSSGSFVGFLQDESGQPLDNIVIALLQKSPDDALPILARTDQNGKIHIGDLEGGSYELLIKNANYQNPSHNIFQVFPGRTTLITLVLQQLFHLDAFDQDNISLKSLLRSAGGKRLIFRELPGPGEETPSANEPFFEDAVFEVYSSAGLDGDYLVFPEDGAGGTTSNFALVDTGLGNTKHIVAGQLNSGEDSLWRVKNFVEFPVADHHSLQMFVGYGRMSFDQPSLALLNNPLTLGEDPGYTRALGTTRMLTVGLQDKLLLGETLSFLWGLELNRLQSNSSQTFVSPNAQVVFSPTDRTRVQVVMASKRSTHRGSVLLPDGDTVNLNDAVHFSRTGDHLRAGTSRYYQTSISHAIDSATEIELAAYQDRTFSGASPLLAVFESQPELQILYLDEEQTSRGYRMTVRRRLGSNLKTSVSYVRGEGSGMETRTATLLVDPTLWQALVSREQYYGIFTHVEAEIPSSGTQVSALLKFIPSGSPITTLDSFSDTYETGNQGINLFVRQVIPVPIEWLSMVGLDFLSSYKIEMLLDIRNLTDEKVGRVNTEEGDVVLVRTPRMVRGGIAVRF